MPDLSNATPRPWILADENRDDLKRYARFAPVVIYAEHDCDIHPIADCSCNHTCRDDDQQRDNASLIVTAVNCHDELLSILRGCADAFEATGNYPPVYTRVLAALARSDAP